MVTETRVTAHASAPRLDPASFRDPSGGVLTAGDRILRYFRDPAAADFRDVMSGGLLQRLEQAGSIVKTTAIERSADLPLYDEVEALTNGRVGLIVEHERLPFVSYAYSWPFEMLRAAAVSHLETAEAALESGCMLKDATPYNMQFRGAAAVFIDVASLEKYEDGQSWTGYAQFCRTFLNPLLLQACRGVPFQPWMRYSLEGIDPAVLSRLLGLKNKLRPSVFIHVVTQAWLNRRFAGSGDTVKQAGTRSIRKEATLGLIRGLRKTVAGLKRPGKAITTWLEYEENLPYGEDARLAKERFVEESVRQANPGVVWDLGCNRGLFSAIAARHADYVVAMDNDEATVGALYEHVATKHTNILPLVVDLSNPDPDQGWGQGERKGLSARGPADFALALALVHHLRISGNVPLNRIFSWLADVARAGVIEFVPKSDPMVKRLLSTRSDVYPDYTEEGFEAAMATEFRVDEKLPLPGSDRILYRITRL